MKKLLLLSTAVLGLVSASAQTTKNQIEKLPAEKQKYDIVKSPTKAQQFIKNMKTLSKGDRSAETNDINQSIPVDHSGKLVSVDGHEVTFEVPKNPEISSVCFTPTPVINGESKDASCSYVVPCDNPANRDAASTTIKYFQCIWHVMWDGGASSNIDQTRIDALMAELNADFASHNMVFCADPANFYEDATNYYHDENTEEVSLKTTYVTNPTQLINIYVVGTMGAGGYARFPYDPMGGTSNTGGIVLARGNCSVGTHTLAHEMGHTFGLEHTFAGIDERGTCSSCYEKVRNTNGSSNTTGVGTPLGGPYTDEGDREGDWCSDTHPHATNSYDCSNYTGTQQACDAFAPTNPPVNNHMSYSFCTSQFTDQQARRMHCMVGTYLSAWTAYGGGVCGTLPPTADFVATPTTWNSPLVASFTDLSAPTSIIDSVEWIFDVGASGTVTCAGCTGANARWTQDLSAVTTASTPPNVTYTNTGLYTVSLTVYSSNGNDTETKVDYIEVLTPAGECDTLTTQWETPTPTVITYGFGGGWITGVQDPVNSISPTDPKGVYERYFTPTPGVTEVGAVRVGMGTLVDADDDMTFQVVIYDDDGFGAPGAVVGGVGGISPTAIGIPGAGFYNEVWIPFNAPLVPTTGTFHVGVEIFPGDATDTLVVMTSCLGPTGCAAPEGENDASNHIWTTGFGYENLQTVYGADFDVDLIPMLGPWQPLPVITGFTENVVCDTTTVTMSDTSFYSDPVSWSFTFSDGTVMNYTSDPGTITRTYTSPGPDTVEIVAINSCGRADTTSWVIPYNFMETPDADFTKDLGNPVCLSAQPITFNANTTGYTDYTWDFGDGTTLTGTDSSPTHSYASIGTYYVSLTVTSPGYQPADTTFLEDFELGIPGTWATFDNNGSVGQANPPFDGTNATAWTPLDFNGTGDTEAYSTGWNNPTTTPSDDWLISPNIAIAAGNSLAWDGESQLATFPDAYEVYVTDGTNPQTVAGCLAGTMVYSTTAENAFTTQHVVDLPAYGFTGGNIKVCFRNNSGGDQYYLAIDNVRVGTTGAGCTNTEQKLDFVEIVDCSTTAPVADGVADVTSGCGPLTVNFTDASTNTPTSWTWNFGDGTFSTAQNPGAHVYNTPGTYFVSLEACNAGGCSTDNFTITVTGLTEDASYSYSSTSECVSGTDMTATITGTTGGTFTSSPAAGISLNASTGAIDVSATTPGSYDITYTTSGGPCAATSVITITVNADQDATFSYGAASYCQSDADPTPTITGTAGGTFTSVPAGLSINASTGTIDNSASTAGAYTVTYTTPGPCAASSNVAVTINADDDPSFTLSSASECQSGTDITATVTGTGGGTFSSSPAGLSLNTSTGDIDVSASTPGSYTVTYTTSGTCPASSNVAVTINADEDASFTLSSSNECQSGTDVTATITGTSGGTFSSAPAGLSINTTTGDIDVSASTAGSYTVTYTTPGSCSASSNQAITIVADEDASYSYSSTTECQSGTDMTATITGTTGGTFSSTPAGLSLNAATGTIDVSASTAGTYDVTYTTGGTCSASSIISVTINADDDASFSYSAGTYCVSGTDPTPTVTGTGGGTFTGTGGLVINAATGEIDLDASGTGSYTVTYTTSGTCPASSNAAINITTAPDATFSYAGSPYCENAGTASVTYGPGASGGTFTAVPAGLTLNASTGDVNLNTSTPGTYTVTNTIAAAGGCAPAAAVASITIDPQEDASYSLSSTNECQGGTDITATITGTTGGTFSSTPAGLALNATTGDIDVSASTAGVYTVTYTTPGTCSDFMDIVVTIAADEDASFSLSSTTECQGGTDITATITGTAGGSFSSTPAGLTLNTTTGDIDVSASSAGTYDVTYTTPGACSVSSIISVTINADDDASFSYSAGTFCVSGTDPTPTITGTGGGTFTATGGLTINALTGEIDLDSPGVGSYTVTYTTSGTCPASSNAAVNITNAPDATFSYAGTPYCENGGTATVTYGPGASGGTFSATPAGLSLNTSTGDIDLGLSTPGTYTVTNDIAASGGCAAASANTSITITPLDDAGFNYSASSYCQSDSDPTPTVNTAGGTFTSSPAGLVITAGTGDIDVSASTVGTYTVTYTTAGACPNSSNASITINADDDPTYSLSSTTECQSGTDITATITGTAGGTFTASPAGLSINGTTGDIDVSASTAGVYTVTYTTTGVCPASMDIAVTITANDDPTFNYGSSSYCIAATDPTPTVSGTPGGSFSATPVGLVINASTGEIDVSASSIGSYTVMYTTAGTCPDSSTVTVDITAIDDPTFSYSASDYCLGSGFVTPTITGTTGGTFSATPTGSGIDPSTGSINLTTASAGTYTVQYTTSGACADSSTVTVTLNDTPVLAAMNDTTVCASFTLPAIGGTSLSGGEAYYDGPGGTGTSYSAGASLTASDTIYIYDANGTCTDETFFVLTVDEMPTTADAGTDLTVCDDVTTVTLSGNTPTVGTGMWSVVSGTGTFTNDMDPMTDVSGLSTGANEFMWMITNGTCASSMDHVIITLEPCDTIPELSIPTAFTPDGGDQTNATWEITGIEAYPDCEVFIHNKWGSEIFYSQGYPDPWDGTYNGSPMPVGAYYFVIKLNDGSEPIKGTVTIIK